MCGGDASKTDRKQTLKAYGELGDVYGTLRDFGTKVGKGATADIASGASDTSKAAKTYSDILSGDPSKVLAASAPEVKAITGQAEQQKKEMTQTGDRTGGKNAAAQDITSNTRGQIADVIAKKRGEAAGGLERTGAQRTSTGLSKEGLELGGETAAGETAGKLGSLSNEARKTSAQIHSQTMQDWGNLVAGFMGFL